MDPDDWCDLDLAYLEIFGEHPDIPPPPAGFPSSIYCPPPRPLDAHLEAGRSPEEDEPR